MSQQREPANIFYGSAGFHNSLKVIYNLIPLKNNVFTHLTDAKIRKILSLQSQQ